MKFERPETYTMCYSCGAILLPDMPPPGDNKWVFSVLSSGNPQKCPICSADVVPRAQIVSELPEIPTVLEATCPNEKCLAYYRGTEEDYGKYSGCEFCGALVTFPGNY